MPRASSEAAMMVTPHSSRRALNGAFQARSTPNPERRFETIQRYHRIIVRVCGELAYLWPGQTSCAFAKSMIACSARSAAPGASAF